MAKFWEALQKALGVQLLMSTTAHPQTDGQSEAAVKVIQKLLKPFVFQGQDWEELLPSLKFAYNDTVQSSTGQTPFYLNYGHHPTGVTRHETVDNPHAEDKVWYLLCLQAVKGILTWSNPNIRIFDVESWICQTIRLHRFVESNP